MVTAMRACLKRMQLDVYDVGAVLNELFAQLEAAGGGRITREIFKQVCCAVCACVVCCLCVCTYAML